MKKCIIVIGMHRSGTSLVTKALETLGVSLGENLMPPAEHNKKGFFEDLDVVDLNSKLLDIAKMNWASLNEFPLSLLESPQGKLLKKEAIDLVTKKTDKNSIWGIKDPRMCRTLPFWKEIFKSLNIETGYVFCLRNPIDVSKSLTKRDNFEMEYGLHMWAHHSYLGLTNILNEKTFVIDFHEFAASPEKDIELMSELFELEPDKNRLEEFKSKFVDKNLIHSSSELEDLKENESVDGFIVDFYEFLKSLTGKNMVKDETAQNLKNFKDNYMKYSSGSIHRFNFISQERRNQIQELDLVNHELKEQISALENNLKDIENAYHDLNQVNNFHMNELEKTEKNLQALLDSKSWRYTRPLRKLLSFLKSDN